MKNYEFRLAISPDQYLAYYRGTAKQVIARCPDGLTIQFPASLLKQFVTSEGIHGVFVLSCGDDNKGAELKRKPGSR